MGWCALALLAHPGLGLETRGEPAANQATLPAPADPAAQPLDAARQDRELRQEQLQVALELYRAFPRGDAVLVLATVYKEQGDFDTASRYWEEGSRQEPSELRLYDRAAAFAGLGELLQAKGDRDRAELMLREALRLKPRQQETWVRLGQILYDQGRLDECLQVLDQGKTTSARSLGLRGQALQRLGNLEEARRRYAEAVRLKPDFTEGLYGLSTTCARLGDTAQAEEYRSQFLLLKSQQQAAGRELRMGLNPLRNTQESFAQTHTQVGWVYQSRDRSDLAEKLWQRAREVDAENTAVRFHLLMLFQKSSRNQEALQVCREMIRAEPANASHQISLGNLQTRLGQYQEAEASYRKALRLAPDRPEAPFALAQFLLQRNAGLDEAVRLANQAVSLAPAAPHYFVLSRACARVKDLPAALAAADRACELDPGNRQFQNFRTSLKSSK